MTCTYLYMYNSLTGACRNIIQWRPMYGKLKGRPRNRRKLQNILAPTNSALHVVKKN